MQRLDPIEQDWEMLDPENVKSGAPQPDEKKSHPPESFEALYSKILAELAAEKENRQTDRKFLEEKMQELGIKSKELQETREHQAQYSAQIKWLGENIQALKNEKEESDKILQQKNSKINTLLGLLDKTKKEKAGLQQTLEQHNEVSRSQEGELTSLREQLTIMVEENNKLAAYLNDCKTNLSTLTYDYASIKLDYAKEKKKAEETLLELKMIKHSLTLTNNELAQKSQEYSSAQAQIKRLRQKHPKNPSSSALFFSEEAYYSDSSIKKRHR